MIVQTTKYNRNIDENAVIANLYKVGLYVKISHGFGMKKREALFIKILKNKSSRVLKYHFQETFDFKLTKLYINL